MWGFREPVVSFGLDLGRFTSLNSRKPLVGGLFLVFPFSPWYTLSSLRADHMSHLPGSAKSPATIYMSHALHLPWSMDSHLRAGIHTYDIQASPQSHPHKLNACVLSAVCTLLHTNLTRIGRNIALFSFRLLPSPACVGLWYINE